MIPLITSLINQVLTLNKPWGYEWKAIRKQLIESWSDFDQWLLMLDAHQETHGNGQAATAYKGWSKAPTQKTTSRKSSIVPQALSWFFPFRLSHHSFLFCETALVLSGKVRGEPYISKDFTAPVYKGIASAEQDSNQRGKVLLPFIIMLEWFLAIYHENQVRMHLRFRKFYMLPNRWLNRILPLLEQQQQLTHTLSLIQTHQCHFLLCSSAATTEWTTWGYVKKQAPNVDKILTITKRIYRITITFQPMTPNVGFS